MITLLWVIVHSENSLSKVFYFTQQLPLMCFKY